MRTRSELPVKQRPPADLAEVKRRFIRQNRELAKNNSSQSLRIRSLELEVSKLLSDNLELREQVLGLQNELYDARVQASSAAAKRLKVQLRAQIAQLAGLVDGIDEDGSEGIEKAVPEEKERILSPSRREYRERQPLAELMRDTQMPTINEDKTFPRRTLDAEQINEIRLSAGSSGSVELGPPPVAHFVDSQESVEQEPAPEKENVESPQVDEEGLMPSVEITRRKRKDPSQSSRRSSILAESLLSADDEKPSTMLRTGAKRKLADRDLEKANKPPSQADFTFSRKSAIEQPVAEKPKASEPTVEIKASNENVERPTSPVRPERKILGEKSTNMSPRKAAVPAGKPVKKGLINSTVPKMEAEKGRPASRGSRRLSSLNVPPSPEPKEIVTTVEIPAPEPEPEPAELDPKTPFIAAEDVFSPPQSHPSTGTNMSRHGTPPPAELSSLSNTTEGSQRPSRRARAAVSYAEPSLTAKMRRPDKKMVDAVSGLRDPRLVMSTSSRSSIDRRTSGDISERSMTGISGGQKRTGTGEVKIKSEPFEDEDWKATLENTSRPSMGSPLRRRDASSTPDLPAQSPLRPSSAAGSDTASTLSTRTPAGISNLLAQSRKRREAMDARDAERESRRSSPSIPSDDSITAAAKKLEELELYDFKDSSSPATEEAAETKKSGHRRHSSVPKPAAAASTSSGDTQRVASTRVASRRRSMML
ncbi:Shugoshin [Pseudocercospora fuligena]|uniref:Shugoshin n=1 Tax=Pseudocercospora fuligena TaxID=685502 RepID=A0A8H6RMT7_9PEZI|nr:Shugoshin [Pseudocercospora fuligena]